ncbi:hypothetical protein BCY86_03965 [Pajaroellobacter abortibovis]|uniref:Uncharacterized protein n=1 Tax=Pajaroellobacter abortibovis TaxID=1882918 RepID=A0A1L6MWY0_9BACT|nr:hypothetical protein BCY86_03965 [Pajaroellobacter abortibovis]
MAINLEIQCSAISFLFHLLLCLSDRDFTQNGFKDLVNWSTSEIKRLKMEINEEHLGYCESDSDSDSTEEFHQYSKKSNKAISDFIKLLLILKISQSWIEMS